MGSSFLNHYQQATERLLEARMNEAGFNAITIVRDKRGRWHAVSTCKQNVEHRAEGATIPEVLLALTAVCK